MLRLLANENVPGDAILALRAMGHDVEWIRESARGVRDEQVLSRALTQQRLLITFDKDFGELVFRRGRSASVGVVLFRISMRSPTHVAERVLAVLESRDDWSGFFSVADDTRLRMVPLPSN